MNELIEIEGGEVLANVDERTITGLLIPYGEVGRTNVGQFEVEAGVITIPTDPSVVSLNVDHDRYSPVGRATKVWEESAGIMATFKLAETPEGDAALADARDPKGKRRRLSGEFRTGIKAGKATGGNLAAAGLVEMGAFPSAMVLAADTPEPGAEYDAPESTSSSTYVNEFTDEKGTRWRRVEENVRTTTVTKVDGETPEEDKEATDVADTNTEVQATVDLPNKPGQTKARTPERRDILAAIATLKWSNPFDEGAKGVLAALSDIKLTGSGALPGADVLRPNWLGAVNLGDAYVREYIGLCKLGTDITAAGKADFKFTRRGTWSDGTWTGNKTEINSGAGDTSKRTSSFERYARGADIGREFFDLPGGEDVIAAFLAELEADYLQWSDEKALALIVETAGAPVAPAVYPGVDGHDYAGAVGQLIQGILAVKKRKADGRRDTPSFAIANELAYNELIYTPKDLLPEFVSIDVNTDGTGTADGKVHVVQGDTGVEDTSSVIVGAGYGIEFDELPGGPLHVNALDIVKGGVDEAVHGYLQKFVRRAEAFVHIGVADA
ncbi:hypothetical protein [Microbacterium kyungheense]|uniref:HK97 family phage prohead protease n=1 Tax=Microbacterium kyungheense TaxID=1263636 RepID=A0A543EU61_9MICO|nr:hypothetical protein [Microbacterium kyungheense]TQM25111.1 hypothetical protein FB391_2570 [Microbacterium kyungheense]